MSSGPIFPCGTPHPRLQLNARVVHKQFGAGALLGWKHAGVRTGDTSGGLQSDNYVRILFDTRYGSASGWNVDASHVVFEAVVPTCSRAGCSRPTFNGLPGFCSKTCRDSKVAGAAVCSVPGCNRPTWDGRPGFCSKTCRDGGAKAGKAAPASDGRAYAQQAAPAAPPAKREVQDDSKQPFLTQFLAFHGTTMRAAQSIQNQGFQISDTGCLGAGVYVTEDLNKAKRFAFDTAKKLRERGEVPALITVMATVYEPKMDVPGDDDTWQAAGFDSCRAVRTSKSTRSEWCILDPSQIQVQKVESLQGQERPKN
mmetsp:Transcript_18731/g.35149  ORF Transcript_18731/g.35149 Transcript_18731/m.35149 type:complete len:311 (-) Transcript_18731:163-1095(-)